MSSHLALSKHLRFSERLSCVKNSDDTLIRNEVCLKYLLNLSGSNDLGFAQQNLCIWKTMEVHPLTLRRNRGVPCRAILTKQDTYVNKTNFHGNFYS